MSGAVRMRDVADRAGVSLPTVSHVLSGKREGVWVSEATRLRVAEIAREMGYKRNNSAVAMKSGRFGSVALLLSTRGDVSNLPPRLLSGIHGALSRSNTHLLVAALPDEALTDAGTVPRILSEWACDGLLINYTDHIPARMRELIRDHRLPAVWINSQQEADCVCPADQLAAHDVTRRLLELGHRRITWADSLHDPGDAEAHYSARARREGYQDAMRERGLEPIFLGKPLLRRERLRQVLREPGRPTAVVCYGSNDLVSVALAAASLGLEVPRDLSLATFCPQSEVLGEEPIAGAVIPESNVGEHAAQMLLQKIEAPDDPLQPREVRFEIQEGATWGPPHETAL